MKGESIMRYVIVSVVKGEAGKFNEELRKELRSAVRELEMKTK